MHMRALFHQLHDSPRRPDTGPVRPVLRNWLRRMLRPGTSDDPQASRLGFRDTSEQGRVYGSHPGFLARATPPALFSGVRWIHSNGKRSGRSRFRGRSRPVPV